MKKQLYLFHDYACYKYDGLTECVLYSILWIIVIICTRFIYDVDLAKTVALLILPFHTILAFLHILLRAIFYHAEYRNPEPDGPFQLRKTTKETLFEIIMMLIVFIAGVKVILFFAGMDFSDIYNIYSEPIKIMLTHFEEEFIK
ncbi:MAG: hypothetical protein IJU53_12085 [Thermoguttaceae bacterium]|nr:hypothetical protein [Thermoguttaceae bacterium]